MQATQPASAPSKAAASLAATDQRDSSERRAPLPDRAAVIGVDPGLGGALVRVTRLGETGAFDLDHQHRTPILKEGRGRSHYDESECVEIVLEMMCGVDVIAFAVEDLVAAPRVFQIGAEGDVEHGKFSHGSNGAFRLGYGVGLWIGIAKACKLPVVRVRPQAWQASTLVGLPRGPQVKVSAARRARDLYPTLRLASKKDWGMADAALIATHVLRGFEGNRRS